MFKHIASRRVCPHEPMHHAIAMRCSKWAEARRSKVWERFGGVGYLQPRLARVIRKRPATIGAPVRDVVQGWRQHLSYLFLLQLGWTMFFSLLESTTQLIVCLRLFFGPYPLQ